MQKAGITDLPGIRKASIETLLAVPGISEIKARHIMDFLAHCAPETTEPNPSVRPAKKSSSDPTAEGKRDKPRNKPARSEKKLSTDVPTAEDVPQADESAAESPLETMAHMAHDRAAHLLVSDRAADFRPKLIKELVRFTRLAGNVLQKSADISPKERDRIIKRVRRAWESLSPVEGIADFDRKAQSRLAEELAEVNDRIEKVEGDRDRKSDHGDGQ